MSENSTHMENKVEEPTMCTQKEKLGHAIAVLGHDSAYTLWGTWATPFMTDILVLPPAFLGAILAGARFFDAFTDISMGVIADRTRSKWGRFRPWILRAGPLFCLFMALSFIKPPLGTTGMCVFAGIMFILTGSIFFTAVDIPFWSLPAAMTSNPKERDGIIGTTTTFSNAITGIIGVIMPVALGALGEFEWTSYFTIAAVVAVFAAIMYLIGFRMTREHVIPDDTEKFSLSLALKNVFTNQPLLCVQLSNMGFLLGMIMKGGLNYFYFSYNVGNMELMAVGSLIGTVAQVVGAILFTILSKRIGKKACMFGGVIILSLTHLALFFAGWSNVVIIFACSAVSSTALGALIVCVNAMMADTIEYGEWKTGQRNEAMITSTRCFVTKCVMAISGMVVAVTIGVTGYVPGVEQSANVLNAFHGMYSLGTAAVVILGVIPMFFYKLTEKRHAEIMEELAARKANKGDR